MKITNILAAAFFAACVSARAQDNWADSVVSYVPGTGQNTAYETSGAALGAVTTGMDGATPYSISYAAYKTSQIVGVGNGGELTVEFDTPITNDPTDHAGGLDFTIFGNEFFVNGTGGVFSGAYDHAGLTVWVSQDNVNYYELAVPSSYESDFGADSAFPTNQAGNAFLPVSPSLSLASFTGLTSAQALSLYNGSAGGASYSISWAVNAEGTPVDLSSISYVEVQGSSGFGYVDAISRVENVQSVPEPSSAAFLMIAATGAIVLLLRSRRGGLEQTGKRAAVVINDIFST